MIKLKIILGFPKISQFSKKFLVQFPTHLIPGTPRNPEISSNSRGKWVGFYGTYARRQGDFVKFMMIVGFSADLPFAHHCDKHNKML